MKYNTFGVVASVMAGTVILVATACTGDDPVLVPDAVDAGSSSSSSGTVTTSSGTPAKPECAVDADCAPKMPKTTPPDCAVATCDPPTKKCVFKAKDADKDGHAVKVCSAGDVAAIVVGDDCDDSDPSSYPGAWDGPASEVDSGADARPDRCDQRDNDCNGSPDDGKIGVDGGDKTCKCDPTAPLPCYEYENGTPIDGATLDNDNKPKGSCKKGLRSCTNGIPGKCIGAVGPSDEQCDALDHDCDGNPGNGGDGVIGAPTWYKDADGDNSGDQNTAPKMQCAAPGAEWKQGIANNDCNDADPEVSPTLGELCDGKDNNCNTVADDGYNVNSACVAGSNGVCKRNGTLQCVSTSATDCKPGAGTAVDNDNLGSASTDPTIYTQNDSSSYIAAWDWNCNGTIEGRPDGLINYNYATPGAASSLCTGNYQGACEAMSQSQSTCLPVVFPCGQSCGSGCTKAQACGKPLTVAYCLWDHNTADDPVAKCDTYSNAFNKTMFCK